DDFEFCPSLTAEELAEFRRQLSAFGPSSSSSSVSTSPPLSTSTSTSTSSSTSSPPLLHTRTYTTSTRAIPIIDPNNRIPLPISSISRTTSNFTKMNSYSSRPISPYHTAHIYSPPPSMQLNPYSPPRSYAHSHPHNNGPPSFAAMSSAFPWHHATSPPSRPPMVRQFSVPIVDPNNGNVLMPGGMGSMPSSSSGYHHISVR
ncbi:hypothetical protein BC937DRAFT_92633, partial [Endogone sp. FLAS-F59071]